MNRALQAFLFGWLMCGIITAGATNAYFRGEFPSLYASDQNARIRCGGNFVFGLFGPWGLLMATFTTGFFYHGIDFSCRAVRGTRTS